MLKKIPYFFLPKREKFDDEVYRRDRIAVNVAFFGLIYCLLNMTVSAVSGFYYNLYSFTPLLLIVVSALFIFRNNGNTALCVNLIAVAATLRLVPTVYLTGGINSPALSLFLISPVVAILLLGNRPGFFWLSVNLFFIVGFFLLPFFNVHPPKMTDDEPHALFNMFLSIAMLFMVMMAIRTFELITQRARRELSVKNEQLNQSLKELKEAQSQLIQSEKMASLGQLTAGIAHEINNPLNFVSGSLNPLRRNIDEIMRLLEEYASLDKNNFSVKLDEILNHWNEIDLNYTIGEIKTLIDGIEEGSQRTADIVNGLQNFSRRDEGEMKWVKLNEEIESTLLLLQNRLLQNHIEVIKSLGEIPNIMGYSGEVNQVIMNLLNNAIDAIGSNGKIFISTSSDSATVKISIRDTGFGIADNTKSKIFDPFFTTKEIGKGTGLGLSIAYGIIQKHKGIIEVDSELNKGSEFRIIIPVT